MTHESNVPHIRPRRVLNLKAVAICAAVLLAGSVALNRLHGKQVGRTTAHLKQLAEQAQENGTPQDAIRALERYLAFSGGDLASRRRLAELLATHALDDETRRAAYAMNESMLLNDRQDDELRLRQAELAVRLNIPGDAQLHLQQLRERQPDNARVWQLSGLQAEREEHDSQAEEFYREAIRHHSTDAATWSGLAGLLTKRGVAAAEVDALLQQLVSRQPSAGAYRVRGRWLLEQHRDAEAVEALWKGLEYEPDELRLNSLLSSAVLGLDDSQDQRKAQRQRLTNHLEQQVHDHPAADRLRLLQAHTLWEQNHQQQAVASLKQGLSRNPQAFDLQEVLIDYLVSLNQQEEARQAFERLPRHAVSHARWHFLEGRVQMASHDWEAAARAFEQASGFAGADTRVRQRARMSLAVCRRQLGHSDSEMSAWKSILQARPDSPEGRLGMAAAWLETQQYDLAIAEYRQLLDVEGVPELLVSLLIQEQVRLPASRRSWTELNQLLDPQSSPISDETQRRLLTVDLLFAQGQPARAMRQLDYEVLAQPDNLPLQSARRRILSDDRQRLLQHLQQSLLTEPQNAELQTALLRLLARQDTKLAVQHLQQLLPEPRAGAARDQAQRHLIASTGETAAIDLQRVGDHSSAEPLLQAVEQVWNQIVAADATQQSARIAFLARHHSVADLRRILHLLPPETTAESQASAWLAALANTADKSALQQPVEAALRQLIAGEPANMRLRLAYAEQLVQSGTYDGALSVGRQVLQFEPDNAEAMSRLAWILVMTDGDREEAERLSHQASVVAPSDAGVRIVRGLVLAQSDQPQAALPVFRSMSQEARSAESLVYEALAHVRSGALDVARELVQKVEQQEQTDRWRPADRKLLKRVASECRTTMRVTETDRSR